MSDTSFAVPVDPDAINKYIANQIIESALGERLKETVDEALKAFGRFGSDPLKGAVQSEINSQIMSLVKTEFSPQIEAAVREQMTPEFISGLVTGFMASVIAQIDRRF